MNGHHEDFAKLVGYWLGELDEAREAAVEEHYLGCAQCAARLAEVEALAGGVRRAYEGGRVGVFVTPAFVDRLRVRGLRVREYHVPRNGGVNCTIAPHDQMVFGHLDAPLEGVSRLDAIVLHEGEIRLEDVPFDAASGKVIIAPNVAHLRSLPAHREVVRLVAVEPGGERVIGEYTFNHSRDPHA